MTVEEGNKLIVEFMGGRPDMYGRWYYIPQISGLYFLGDDIKDFKYHSSWSWLMPVVEKIESLGYSVFIQNDACWVKPARPKVEQYETTNLEDSKIKATWMTCIDFIEWL